MNLQIRHVTSISSPSTCFICLSKTIASSLSSLQPYASLTVLKLVKSGFPPIHVAWSASTTSDENAIGIHPNFANALLLADATSVIVSVTERVLNNQPRFPIASMTLTPLSYKLCNPQASSGTELSANRDLALRHFEVLATAASTLERSLLQQIRVLQVDLVFPLLLPANDTILVRVTSITIRDGADSNYAVLQPDSRVEIEPPPAPSIGRGVKSERFCLFARVLPPSKVPASTRLRKLVSTCVVLPGSCETTGSEANEQFVMVSRKRGKGLGLPGIVAYDDAIAEGCVSLPGAFWEGLRIGHEALVPVLVESIDEVMGRGEKVVLKSDDGIENAGVCLLDWEEIVEKRGVYWDGMAVSGGRLHVVGEGARKVRESKRGEIWDRVGVKASMVLDSSVDERFIVHGEMEEDLLRAARTNRETKRSFRAYEGQTLVAEGEGIRQQAAGNETYNGNSRQLRRMDTKRQALLSLTKTGRDAIESIVKVGKRLFSRSKTTSGQDNGCKAVVVQGGLGAGKTHVCRAVGSLFREMANARTVWIRGKAHGNELGEVSVARIRRAFQEAVDGGPGVIILDDIDALLGNVEGNSAGTEGADPVAESSRLHLSQFIADRVSRVYENPVLLIMSCERAENLEMNLRSPGIIERIVDLCLPTSQERALMFWTSLQNLDVQPPARENVSHLRDDVSHLGDLSEGYSPKDIQIALKRVRVAMKVHPLSSELVDLHQIIPMLKEVLEKMTPASRAGVEFAKARAGEKLSWAKIGGLDSAKNEIWQVLELPASRPEIFASAPIRLPHGILLYGPPGCGKTVLARTSAVESGMRCLMVKGPELLSKYIGESEAEVRRAFEKAASAAPCMLLFDEFDALAPRRGGEGTGVADRVVNTLLTCMDGAERLAEGVYVVATTSRPELIDPALLRPGRLDRWIAVDIPTSTLQRLDILRCLCADYFPSTKRMDGLLEYIAENTDGYTGADLGAVLNDAYLNAGKRKRTNLDCDDGLSEIVREALRDSRPSLSRSQRDYFEHVMKRFSKEDGQIPSDVYSSSSYLFDTNGENATAYGKKLALQ